MKLVVFAYIVVCVAGCTVRDASFCRDDSECANAGDRLYCDSTGALEGVPNHCIVPPEGPTACDSNSDCTDPSAAKCTEQMCAPCAVSDACAHLLDTPVCESGVCIAEGACGGCGASAPVCFAGGTCGGCRTDLDCEDLGLKCDIFSGACRECGKHSDCGDSHVCDRGAGTCVEPSLVDYITTSDEGQSRTSCLPNAPCSWATAAVGTKQWIHLEPSAIPYQFGGSSISRTSRLTIVGSDARGATPVQLDGTETFNTNGQPFTLDSLDLTSSGTVGISCTLQIALSFYNVEIETPSGTSLSISNMCNATVVGSTIRDSIVAASVDSGGTLTIDQSSLPGNLTAVKCGAIGVSTVSVKRTMISGTDAIGGAAFELNECNATVHNNIVFGYDAGGGMTDLTEAVFGFNTFEVSGTSFNCDSGPNVLSVEFFGNLFVIATPGPPGDCDHARDIISDDSGLIDADSYAPLTPAAVDAYTLDPEGVGVDFHGTPRPQGAYHDYGAVEVVKAP